MKTTTLSAIVAASLVGAVGLASIGPVLAAGGKDHRGGPRHGFDFEQIDANGDGKITPEEMSTAGNARFAAGDTDGDGLMSQEEMVAAMIEHAKIRGSERVARMFERRDANGDGFLSMDEMRPSEDRHARMFDRLDADGDGAISKDEVAGMKDKRMKRRKHWGQNDE